MFRCARVVVLVLLLAGYWMAHGFYPTSPFSAVCLFRLLSFIFHLTFHRSLFCSLLSSSLSLFCLFQLSRQRPYIHFPFLSYISSYIRTLPRISGSYISRPICKSISVPVPVPGPLGSRLQAPMPFGLQTTSFPLQTTSSNFKLRLRLQASAPDSRRAGADVGRWWVSGTRSGATTYIAGLCPTASAWMRSAQCAPPA